MTALSSNRWNMDKEEYTNKIKALYNECWNSYKQYYSDHDMSQYNIRQKEIVVKYDCVEVRSLLLFFAPIVNQLHEMLVEESGGDDRL